MANPRKFKTDWELDTYDSAEAAMKVLLNLANACGSSKAVVAGMLDAFISEHRTLQQSGIRNFVTMLQEWVKGDKDRYVDLRNEAGWDFAQEVAGLNLCLPSI